MTGLAVAAVVLAAGFYVALRRVTPVGVGLNPWRYITRCGSRERFERNLPEPGTPICDADPPADLIRELTGRYAGFIGLTRCFMPHGALPRGGAHVGLVVADSRDGLGPLCIRRTRGSSSGRNRPGGRAGVTRGGVGG